MYWDLRSPDLNGPGTQFIQEGPMDYRNLTAPCGIACFECLVFKATTNAAIKKGISEKLGLDYDKSDCIGCRNRNGIGFLSGKNNIFPVGQCILLDETGLCKIYACAEKKQVHNCSECADFPCDLLQPLADRADKIPHNLKAYNLSLIRKMGLEKWATEKAGKVWTDYKTKKAAP
jgi:hypothetical protein